MNGRRPRPNNQVIVSDDLPEAYLRRLLGNRIDYDAAVFSRSDALRVAESRQRRSQSKHLRLLGRPRRGPAVR